MTLDFQDSTFDVSRGVEPGGGGGTSDHSELTNLDYAHAGHTGFLSSETFIPPDTTITVDASGNGDYTTLQEAFAFLSGKWSSGEVTVSIKNGTYTATAGQSLISFTATAASIPKIIISGESRTGVILKPKFFVRGSLATPVLIRHLTIDCIDATSSAALELYGISAEVQDVLVKNCWAGIYPQNGAIANVGNIYAESISSAAIFPNVGATIIVNGTLTCNSVDCAVTVGWGSTSVIYNVTKAFTSVRVATGQTIGTPTSQGVIYGGFAN